MTYDLI